MWEERTSSYEDTMLIKAWFALYRPFYKRYVFPKERLYVKETVDQSA